MFITIESKNHLYYEDIIASALKLINNHSLKISFQNHKEATFIISLGERGIYGGAILLKQKITSPSLMLKKKELWTCTTFLHRENCFSEGAKFFFEAFYRNLYKKLIEFGEKENTDGLYTILTPGDYLCTEALGSWPYISKIAFLQSLDGLYHNILSLIKDPLEFSGGLMMGSREIKLAA